MATIAVKPLVLKDVICTIRTDQSRSTTPVSRSFPTPHRSRGTG